MSLYVLLAAALSLGLVGGLHCVAMCTALQRVAVHGVAAAPAEDPASTATVAIHWQHSGTSPVGWRALRPNTADLAFQTARVLGYTLLGAMVGAGSGLLRWGAEVMPLMRPLWGGLNVGLLTLGLMLAVLGRQPLWVDTLAARVWSLTGRRLEARAPRSRPWLAGALWALVPCGLLYSALATAALASDPLRGAAAMAVFGLATAGHLLIAQTLLRALAGQRWFERVGFEAVGMRIGGVLLAGMAAAALWALALGQPHPFCAG